MKRQEKTDSRSLLYYTLTHAITPRKTSPVLNHRKQIKKGEAESGDETDRSIDNEITESFIMDEINENNESCSLNSSRENLLDGEGAKDSRSNSRPNSKPNSRPNSGRMSSFNKTTELPVDERIKALEEGLKEADMEREVVLSCLGKEYLERVTMQNCLQEICSKSGYKYEEVASSVESQGGVRNMLENMLKTRAKDLLQSKNTGFESSKKPQEVNQFPDTKEEKESVGLDTETISKGTISNDEQSDNKITQGKLKEVVAKIAQTENSEVNSELNAVNGDEESSHTSMTKVPRQVTAGTNFKGPVCPSKYDKEKEASICYGSVLPEDQSQIKISKSTEESLKTNPEKKFENQNKGEMFEFESAGACKPMELDRNWGVDSRKMPDEEGGVDDNGEMSFLRILDQKEKGITEKSVDSIDEGILMVKSFLTELLPVKQVSHVHSADQDYQGIVIKDPNNSCENRDDTVTPKRKHSLNGTKSPFSDSELVPQRRRSYAEGMNMRKKATNNRLSGESRLFKPTVSSRNKVKPIHKEAESDSEVAKKVIIKPNKVRRSASDVRYGPKRKMYSSYASAEDDSSVDGDDASVNPDIAPSSVVADGNTVHYVYQTGSEFSNRDYSKLMSILNMLQDQKRKRENEAGELQKKNDKLTKQNADLEHDNNVLRKSLEAANHAIKEINSKVQELKQTIVPLRDENSKLRDQNYSFKAKLDLLRKDKALLTQNIQELRYAKFRYEDKLQIIVDLYKHGQLNLINDDNNSAPEKEISEGGLQALLDISREEQPTHHSGKKRQSRNRDNSKRHSFHGFEKIEELAGNAEQLIADKDQVEEENEHLKREVDELKEKLKTKTNENEVEDEAEIMNQRRGWRMQREESKHRIIREILKTETNRVYGRPYASCSDLTIKEDLDVSKIDLLNEKARGKRLKRPRWNLNKEGSKDQKDSVKGKQEDLKENSGGIFFEVNVSKKNKTNGDFSWKDESEKIARRLSNCKFEKGIEAEKGAKREEMENGKKKDKKKRNDDKVNQKKLSTASNIQRSSEIASDHSIDVEVKTNIQAARKIESTFNDASTKRKEHQKSTSNHESFGRVDESFGRVDKSFDRVAKSFDRIDNQIVDVNHVDIRRVRPGQGIERSNVNDERQASTAKSTSERFALTSKELASFHERDRKAVNGSKKSTETEISQSNGASIAHDEKLSPSAGWPIVREKIQAIYDQPVEILEESLYERAYNSRDSSSERVDKIVTQERERRMINPNEILSRSEGDEYSAKPGAENRIGGRRDQQEHFYRNGDCKRSDAEFVRGGQKRQSKNKTEDNWQRKSSTEEWASYEDYRRKTRQPEIEFPNDATKPVLGTDMNEQKSNFLPEFVSDGKVYVKNEVLFSSQGTSRDTRGITREAFGVDQDDVLDNNFIIDQNGLQDQVDGSAWIKVPVYARNFKGSRVNGGAPHKGNVKKMQNGYQNTEESLIFGGEESTFVEETLTMVDSAFSSAQTKKTSSKTKETINGNKELQANQETSNFAKSSKTVLYLDELADSDSGSSDESPQTLPIRRTRSFRKPRPKSDIFGDVSAETKRSQSHFSGKNVGFERNRSLRLPRRIAKDDMFSVDISFEDKTRDDSFISMQSNSSSYTDGEHIPCQHYHDDYLQSSPKTKKRLQSETGTMSTSSSMIKSKYAAGFSCEMCREMRKKKNAQEKYCWEKYFPIGESTVETLIIREDYV